MSSFYVDNAMAWAQFRLKGGWKNIFSVGAVYAVVIIGVITLTDISMTRPNDRRQAMQAWSDGLLIIQCIILLIVGNQRLRAAIYADITSRQIESHRLMPLQPFQAIVGYITGGMAQLLALSFITFAIGCGTCILASLTLRTWLMSNLLLLGFAFLCWSVTALTAFVGRGAGWLLMIVSLICVFSRGLVFAIAPATLMLCGPMLGHSVFYLDAPMYYLTDSMILAVAAEFILSLIFISAAARKYARDGTTALPASSGLALLGIWIILSWYGISHLPDILSRSMFRDVSESTDPAVVGSLATSILLAMTVMAGVAWANMTARDNRRLGSPSQQIRSIPLSVFLLICVAAVTCLAESILPTPRLQARWVIAALCAISLLQAYVLMRLFYGRLRIANMIIIIYTLFLWLAPLLADFIYYTVAQPQSEPHLDVFSSISPLGLLIQVNTDNHPTGILLGLVAQSALLVMWTLLWLLLGRKPVPAAIPNAPPAPSISISIPEN